MQQNTVSEYEASCREALAEWKGKRQMLDDLITHMTDLRDTLAGIESKFQQTLDASRIESALNVAPNHPGTARLAAAIASTPTT